MTDLLAGAKVKAADRPTAVTATDTTAINNITSTTYIPGSPEVGTTFVAPTSGRVVLTVGGGFRDDTAGTNRVHIAPEVYLGTGSAGSSFLTADVTTRGVGSVGATNFHYRSRTTLLTGLTPGSTYYARIVYKVSGGTTSDIAARDITVVPTS